MLAWTYKAFRGDVSSTPSWQHFMPHAWPPDPILTALFHLFPSQNDTNHSHQRSLVVSRSLSCPHLPSTCLFAHFSVFTDLPLAHTQYVGISGISGTPPCIYETYYSYHQSHAVTKKTFTPFPPFTTTVFIKF